MPPTPPPPPSPHTGRHGRNLTWLIAADFYQKLLAFAFFVYLSRRLSVIENGWYGAFVALFPTLVVIINLGISDVTTRDLAQDRTRLSRYLTSGFLAQIILFLPTFAAVVIAVRILDYSPTLQSMMLVSVLASLALVFSRMTFAVFAAHERFHYTSLIIMIARTAIVAGSIALLELGYGLIAIVAWLALLYALQFIAGLIVVRKNFGPIAAPPSLAQSRYLSAQGWPIALGGLAASALFAFDVPLILHYLGEEAAGYYAIGIRFLIMLMTVPDTLSTLYYPVLSRKVVASPEEEVFALNRCLKTSLIFALPAAVGLSVLADPIVIAVAGDRFAQSAPAVAVLAWVFAIEMVGIVFIMYLRAKGLQRAAMTITTAALAMKLAAAVVLIPLYAESALLATNLAAMLLMAIALAATSLNALPGGRGSVRATVIRSTTSVFIPPTLAALIMGALLLALPPWPIAITIPLGAATYALALYTLGGIDPFDRQLIASALRRAK